MPRCGGERPFLDALPNAKILLRGESVRLKELFIGQRGILFGGPELPVHLTGQRTSELDQLIEFQYSLGKLRNYGIRFTACLYPNEPYALKAWAKARGISESILFISDTNYRLADMLGLTRHHRRSATPVLDKFVILTDQTGEVIWSAIGDDARAGNILSYLRSCANPARNFRAESRSSSQRYHRVPADGYNYYMYESDNYNRSRPRYGPELLEDETYRPPQKQQHHYARDAGRDRVFRSADRSDSLDRCACTRIRCLHCHVHDAGSEQREKSRPQTQYSMERRWPDRKNSEKSDARSRNTTLAEESHSLGPILPADSGPINSARHSQLLNGQPLNADLLSSLLPSQEDPSSFCDDGVLTRKPEASIYVSSCSGEDEPVATVSEDDVPPEEEVRSKVETLDMNTPIFYKWRGLTLDASVRTDLLLTKNLKQVYLSEDSRQDTDTESDGQAALIPPERLSVTSSSTTSSPAMPEAPLDPSCLKIKYTKPSGGHCIHEIAYTPKHLRVSIDLKSHAEGFGSILYNGQRFTAFEFHIVGPSPHNLETTNTFRRPVEIRILHTSNNVHAHVDRPKLLVLAVTFKPPCLTATERENVIASNSFINAVLNIPTLNSETFEVFQAAPKALYEGGFNLQKLVSSSSGYVVYNGVLSSMSEKVTWVVQINPLLISRRQLAAIGAYLYHEEETIRRPEDAYSLAYVFRYIPKLANLKSQSSTVLVDYIIKKTRLLSTVISAVGVSAMRNVCADDKGELARWLRALQQCLIEQEAETADLKQLIVRALSVFKVDCRQMVENLRDPKTKEPTSLYLWEFLPDAQARQLLEQLDLDPKGGDVTGKSSNNAKVFFTRSNTLQTDFQSRAPENSQSSADTHSIERSSSFHNIDEPATQQSSTDAAEDTRSDSSSRSSASSSSSSSVPRRKGSAKPNRKRNADETNQLQEVPPTNNKRSRTPPLPPRPRAPPPLPSVVKNAKKRPIAPPSAPVVATKIAKPKARARGLGEEVDSEQPRRPMRANKREESVDGNPAELPETSGSSSRSSYSSSCSCDDCNKNRADSEGSASGSSSPSRSSASKSSSGSRSTYSDCSCSNSDCSVRQRREAATRAPPALVKGAKAQLGERSEAPIKAVPKKASAVPLTIKATPNGTSKRLAAAAKTAGKARMQEVLRIKPTVAGQASSNESADGMTPVPRKKIKQSRQTVQAIGSSRSRTEGNHLVTPSTAHSFQPAAEGKSKVGPKRALKNGQVGGAKTTHLPADQTNSSATNSSASSCSCESCAGSGSSCSCSSCASASRRRDAEGASSSNSMRQSRSSISSWSEESEQRKTGNGKRGVVSRIRQKTRPIGSASAPDKASVVQEREPKRDVLGVAGKSARSKIAQKQGRETHFIDPKVQEPAPPRRVPIANRGAEMPPSCAPKKRRPAPKSSLRDAREQTEERRMRSVLERLDSEVESSTGEGGGGVEGGELKKPRRNTATSTCSATSNEDKAELVKFMLHQLRRTEDCSKHDEETTGNTHTNTTKLTLSDIRQLYKSQKESVAHLSSTRTKGIKFAARPSVMASDDEEDLEDWNNRRHGRELRLRARKPTAHPMSVTLQQHSSQELLEASADETSPAEEAVVRPAKSAAAAPPTFGRQRGRIMSMKTPALQPKHVLTQLGMV